MYKAEPLFKGSDLDPRWIIKNPSGEMIMTTVGGDDEINAIFIANACNAFQSVEEIEERKKDD